MDQPSDREPRHKGCSLCGTLRKPFLCETCVNRQVLQGKRLVLQQLRNQRDRLEEKLGTALAPKEASVQRTVQQREKAAVLRRASGRASTAQRLLLEVQQEVARLREQNAAKRSALEAASEQLQEAWAQVGQQHVPDALRHRYVLDQLVHKQRDRLRELQAVLPLNITAMRSNHQQQHQQQGAGGGGSREDTAGLMAPYVTILDLRLPDTLNPIVDDGQESQELGAALGYLLLFLDLAAQYLGGPLLHVSAHRGSNSALWLPRSFWDPAPAGPHARLRLHLGSTASAAAAEAAPAEGALDAPATDTSVPTAAAAAAAAAAPQGGVLDALTSLTLRSKSVWHAATAAANSAVASTTGLSSPGGGGRGRGPGLGRALHLLHRTTGAFVGDKLGPTGRALPPGWSTFAWLAALCATAAQDPAQEGKMRAAPPLFSVTSSVFGTPAPGTQPHIVGESNLFKGEEEDESEGWDLIQHVNGWVGGQEGLPVLPPPPSQEECVEHWTRAMYTDARSAPQQGNALSGLAQWWTPALLPFQQMRVNERASEQLRNLRRNLTRP